jgi:D-3-phosphoglycerate dehydrogenase / 2-oxoglutarate reductase
MKLVGISDLYISKRYCEEGFKIFKKLGLTVEIIEWQIKNSSEIQRINLLVEKNGSESYEPPEYILRAVRDANIIITQFCTVTKKLIDSCNNLNIIGVMRSGYENVNIDYATKKNILVFNTPGRNSNAVADFTIGMLLAECRNISKGHCYLKNAQWVKKYPNSGNIPDLFGKIVGIIGLGEIGSKVAKRLSGFDVKLLGYDPFVRSTKYDIELVDLDKLVEESDFITIHAKLNKKTEKLINKRLIDKMKPTAYLINTARGGLVDEEALYEALKNNRIAGAAIDVFNIEPVLNGNLLITLDNITVTPHMAGLTEDSIKNSPKILAKDIIKLWSEEEPHFIVNKDLYKKLINTKNYLNIWK